jgi:uncharacterized protein YndB with AHSA1/START domain
VPDILVRSIELACPIDHAFDVFTGKIDLWWPRGHRRNANATLRFDGESIVERAADGADWTMARVSEIDPPNFLSLDWFPGSPAAPTAVEIRFAATDAGTTITVTHRALSASADAIWPQRVALFTKGWDTVLPALKTFIEET